MKTNRKILIAVVVVLTVALLTFGTYAATNHYVKNDVATGQVVVTLNGPNKQDVTIHPGEKLISGFSVTNKGDTAYVRVKVVSEFDKEIVEPDPSLIQLTSVAGDQSWEAHDGYYYYMYPMEKNTTSEIFVTVSGEMGNKYAGKKANIKVVAQAVQVAHNPEQSEWEGKLVDPWTAQWGEYK